ncbi:MAG TPA: hypothetical protein VFL93_10100 [Longimicrobiaceae bacterium]|nr:hypothetical protein [Longimicrobiaceae bacterium]
MARVADAVISAVLGRRVPAPAALPPGLLPEGVVLRRGRLVPRIGGLLARMGGPAAAVTLRGTVIVHPAMEATPVLLAHELTHVRQWSADPLFPLRYTWATLRHGYHDNPYEVEARAAEAAFASRS